MIAYSCGVYDILRAKDLQKLDMQIQLSRQEGAECFGLGIYDKNLCENLGLNMPLKSLSDRMKIMEQIRGVDFVFEVPSLHEEIIKKNAEEAYDIYKYYNQIQTNKRKEHKKYEIGYAPGTYDLFHAGHLENLMIASKDCDKLIVGVKSDELVQKHKNRTPIISAEERMEILRHFKFTYGVYQYYTRNLNIANEWIKSKYGKQVDAVFLGSDLKKDFSDTQGLNIIYTPRDKELMKTRSTTAYRKIHLNRKNKENYTGNIKQIADNNKAQEDNELDL